MRHAFETDERREFREISRRFYRGRDSKPHANEWDEAGVHPLGIASKSWRARSVGLWG